jgi:hypothetical protein
MAGRVYNDLRNLARREGRSTDEVMVTYLLERFLFRMAAGAPEHFVLKGGLLLARFGARRFTRDIDLLARGMPSDESHVIARVRGCARVEVDDGVVFDVQQMRATTIREDDAYPIQTVLAEKVTTALRLADANTREQDWADMWRLTGIHNLGAGEMRAALEPTARHRGIALRPLSAVIVSLPDLRSRSYDAWRRRQGVDAAAYPNDLHRVVRDVVAFADPLLDGHHRVTTWSAGRRVWG